MVLVGIGDHIQIVTTLVATPGGVMTRTVGAVSITIYDSAGGVIVNAAPMAALVAGIGIYGYSWATVGLAAGDYTAVCFGAAPTDICIPAAFNIELRTYDEDDTFASQLAHMGDIEAKVDIVDTNVDTLVTRVPGLVAQKSHLVNGTGDIVPPANKGIWDYLEAMGQPTHTLDAMYAAMVKQAPGAFACILTVNDGVGALANVDVWLSSDALGANIVAGQVQTDVLGHVTFFLDNATYFVWLQKIGYTQPTPPGTWVVLGATNKTLSLTSTGAIAAATYCTYADVGNLMQVTFGAGGKPTASDVDALIVMAEDAVDNDLSAGDRKKSWKLHTETDLYLDYDGMLRLDLGRADVRAITLSKLFYFNGTDFTDFITEGDDKDFYVDKERGVIHFPSALGLGSTIPAFWDTRAAQNVKIGFTWGALTVPKYVKLATMLKTAMLIAANDDYADVFTTGDGRVQTVTKLQQYERLYRELIETHREVR